MNFRAEHHITPKVTHRCACGLERRADLLVCRNCRPKRKPRRWSSQGYELHRILRMAIDEARA